MLLMVFVAGIGFVAGDADATNGYFAHGYSIESKAMGGAGVALPQGSLDASVNPALMVFVGNSADISLSLFNPNREYSVTGNPSGFPGTFGFTPGTYESDSKYFLVPAMGVNWSLNNKTSVGVSIFGNGGMNTDYNTNTYYDFSVSTTGIDLMQLFIVPTLSVKIAPRHSLGFSPIFAYQRFEQIGLQSLGDMGFSSDPNHIANNDHEGSYGFGGRIGYYGEIMPYLSVGASYQTKIWMTTLDEYAGLFAEQGGFNIPANWTIGVAVKPTPALAFLFDVQKIYYSDIKSIGNPMLPNLMTAQLGNDEGSGFGWDDMTVYKAGVQWKSSDAWTWRAGYSFANQPIPNSELPFNILAPGVIEQHATAGFTKAMSKTQNLSFSLMHAFSKTVSGPNTLEVPGLQAIKLKMSQWEATLGYTWKF
ncbi:MAG: outer membrane protein transport protein [Nitrospirae bacterium]|nr:outer membrane protein transport protein [Nitrospirota bacterium]